MSARHLFILLAVLTLPSAASAGLVDDLLAARDPEEVLTRAAQSVVMVVELQADGTLHVGAGLLAGDGDMVLTALPLATGGAALAVLPWRDDRVARPVDQGGLLRTLVEARAQLVGASLISADPRSSLALLRLHEAVPRASRVRVLTRYGRPAEPLVLIGHTAAGAWSRTAAEVVDSNEQLIRVNGTMEPGLLGAPAVVPRWGVLGLRIDDGDQGGRLTPAVHGDNLLRAAREHRELDLKTPERAELSCAGSLGLGLEDMVRCTFWGATFESAEIAAAQATAILAARGDGGDAPRPGPWADWLRGDRSAAQAGLDRSGQVRAALAQRAQQAGEDDSQWAAVAAQALAGDAGPGELDEALLERNGLVVGAARVQLATLEALQTGLTVRQVVQVDDAHAWLRVDGTNLDGTPFHYSRLRVRVGVDWASHPAPQDEELATMPTGWPLPIDDPQRLQSELLAGMLATEETR
jgi:hypothetical protein